MREGQLARRAERGLASGEVALCSSERGRVALECGRDRLLRLVVEVAAEQRSVARRQRLRAVVRGARVGRRCTHVHRVRGVQRAELLVRVSRREVLVAVEQRVVVVLLERRRHGQLEDVRARHRRRAAVGRLGAQCARARARC